MASLEPRDPRSNSALELAETLGLFLPLLRSSFWLGGGFIVGFKPTRDHGVLTALGFGQKEGYGLETCEPSHGGERNHVVFFFVFLE